MVRDYNEGKLKALLLSSAGGEGLDLKGTRLVQILEPHWNAEKLKQVEGRAARFGSHSHLSPEEQQVLVERYMSGIEPGLVAKIRQRLFDTKPDQTVDQYLAMMSKNKEDLNAQFRALLPKHEKKAAYEEPSEAKATALHAAGFVAPGLASSLSVPLASLGDHLHHIAVPVAALGGITGGLTTYGAMKGYGARLEAEAKSLAKSVAKNKRRMGQLEDMADPSLGDAAWDVAKGTGASLASHASALMLLQNPLADWRNRKAVGKAALVSLPIHVGGAVARHLEHRNVARMALNRLDAVEKELEESDVKRLARLKKQVTKLESKLSDEL